MFSSCLRGILSHVDLAMSIMGSRSLKIISLNVNGLSNPVKRSRVLAKLRRDKSQVIFLQETHMSNQEHEKLKKFGYLNLFFCSCKNSRRRGVATLISNSVNFLTESIA